MVNNELKRRGLHPIESGDHFEKFLRQSLLNRLAERTG